MLCRLLCSIHKEGKRQGQNPTRVFQYGIQEDRISWRKMYGGMTACHVWTHVQASEKQAGCENFRLQPQSEPFVQSQILL